MDYVIINLCIAASTIIDEAVLPKQRNASSLTVSKQLTTEGQLRRSIPSRVEDYGV